MRTGSLDGPGAVGVPAYVRNGAIQYSLPSTVGKPAVMRLDGAGTPRLWMIGFGTGGSPSKGFGIQGFDISGALPASLGAWIGQAVAGSGGYASTGNLGPYNIYQMRFRGTTCFLSAGGVSTNGTASAGNRLWAVDTTNPAAVTLLGPGFLQFSTVGTQYPYDFDLGNGGNTAIVGFVGTGGIAFVNVTNPAAMTLLPATIPGITVGGINAAQWPIVWISDHASGTLRSYDCSAVPTGGAAVLLGTSAAGVLSTGASRVTIDTVRNLAYVCDTGGGVLGPVQGLAIFGIANPAAPTLISRIPAAVGGSSELQPVTYDYTNPNTGVVSHMLLVCCGASSPGRIETWDVSNPISPALVKVMEAAQALFYAVFANGMLYVGNRGGEQELLVIDQRYLNPGP